ncbi:MAG: ricin-type beta-trefoil lectin domain protein [Lewinellaceae bacterium]|nr:ricin-type beta-trefoil lectin domain protein [Lewinellaceae bacterium]
MKHNQSIENKRSFGVSYWNVLLFLVMLAASFQAAAQQTIYIAHPNNAFKVLQLANNSLSIGTPIVLGDRMDLGTSYKVQQEWYYDNATNTIRLKASPGKCIARRDQQSMNNDPIILVDYIPNNDAQRWVLEGNKIKLLANKNLCIGLSNTNYIVGNPTVLQDANSNSVYQTWYFREKPTQILTADGNLHRVNSPGDTYCEFVVPNPCSYSFLNITARGGDGGYRSVHNIITGKEDVKARGGEGATTQGYFKIGTGAGEIKPGTVIRFVIGRAGDSHKNDGGSKGCGGGGGTGVIYEAPGERNGFYYPWEMLLVAGGGGGAYADALIAHSDGGPGAEIADSGNGLVNGYMQYDVGGGFRADTDPVAKSLTQNSSDVFINEKRAGFKITNGAINPTGAKITEVTIQYNTHGGFGFGTGGMAMEDGGTGGGYTGGIAKRNLRGGGGGTSYLNFGWAKTGEKIKNGLTANPADGYVEYQFTNDGPVTRDLYYQADIGTEVDVLKTNGWTLKWQYDGNLVLYQNGVAKWASNTQNKGTALRFQGDGNLVIYNNGVAVWNSDTPNNHHNGKGGRKLVLTPEGSLTIVDQDGKVIWQGH